MIKRIFVLAILVAMLAACGTPATPAATTAPVTENTLKIVASTSWVGAFALAAGAEDISIIAPSTIQHPPDYDPKPSDLEAISGADYVLYAGFEGFAARMQEAVGGSSDKLITVATENSPEAIHKEVTRLGELFGTQDKAAAFLESFDAEYAKLSDEVKAAVGDQKPVVVTQMFVTPWVFFAGLEPAGMYGPMPMTPDELKTLSDAKPTMIFENYHMGGGDPLVESTGATMIDLINFPGDDMDLLSVFRTNAETLKTAFGGMADMHSHMHTEYPVTIENCGNTLTFEKAPERALVTYQNVAEIMVKLGLTDKIVGVTYGKAYPAPADMPEVDSLNYLTDPGSGSASKEVELSTNPDIVISAYPTYDFDAGQGMATQEEFVAAGAPVYGISAECNKSMPGGTIETVYSDILNLGKIFGVESRAEAVVQEMKDRIAEVQSRVGNLPPVQVAFYDAGEEQLGFYGSGLNSDMIALAGGENVFANETDVYLQVSKEVFAVKTPEIFAILDYEGTAGVPDEITRAEFLFTTFPNMQASKEQRWVPVSGAAFAAGTRIPDAIEAMAKAFHPEAFQ